MKRNGTTLIPGILILIFSLTGAVGIRTFLAPCVHDDGSFGACHWAGQALFGIALLTAAEGVILLFGKSSGFVKGLFICAALTAVLGILLPGNLIGLCGMATMRCRAVMRPAMTILFSLTGVSAVIGAVCSGRNESNH